MFMGPRLSSFLHEHAWAWPTFTPPPLFAPPHPPLLRYSHPILYAIVFGEGIVNDATAIVLLKATEALPNHGGTGKESVSMSEAAILLLPNIAWLFISSLALGTFMGLLSALIIRWVAGGRAGGRGHILRAVVVRRVGGVRVGWWVGGWWVGGLAGTPISPYDGCRPSPSSPLLASSWEQV